MHLRRKAKSKLDRFLNLSSDFFNRDLLEISSHFEDRLKKLELPDRTFYLLLNNQEDGREAFSWGWIFDKRKVTMFLPVFCLMNITEKLCKYMIISISLSLKIDHSFIDTTRWVQQFRFIFRSMLSINSWICMVSQIS